MKQQHARRRKAALIVAAVLPLAACTPEPTVEGSYITTIERSRGFFTEGSSATITMDVEGDRAFRSSAEDSFALQGTIDMQRGILTTDTETFPFQFHKNGNVTMTYRGEVMRFTPKN